VTKGVYFTIQPTDAGFTDQMIQFSAFYKLGLSLGYSYLHTSFSSQRSGSSSAWQQASMAYSDVYDFLGFNAYFHKQTVEMIAKSLCEVGLRLDDALLERHGVRMFPDLQAFVGALLLKSGHVETGVLVRFILAGGRDFFGLIQSSIPNYPDGLDLRDIYFEARRARPWMSTCPAGRLKTLIHIRQGDTAVIETPWHTFIPLRPKENAFIEHRNLADIPNARMMLVEEFRDFLVSLLSHFTFDTLSISVFSDGFKRSFEVLNSERKKLRLTPAQQQWLFASEASYEQRAFEGLRAIPNVRIVLGEDPPQLCDFIHSCLTADLIVTGPQQRLIPKLIATYFTPVNMPVVVVVYRGGRNEENVQSYHGRLGLADRKERLVYVDILDPNIATLACRLTELLEGVRRSRISCV